MACRAWTPSFAVYRSQQPATASRPLPQSMPLPSKIAENGNVPFCPWSRYVLVLGTSFRLRKMGVAINVATVPAGLDTRVRCGQRRQNCVRRLGYFSESAFKSAYIACEASSPRRSMRLTSSPSSSSMASSKLASASLARSSPALPGSTLPARPRPSPSRISRT